MLQRLKPLWFIGLGLLVGGFFKTAFRIHFFQDDYWFLQISRINSVTGFLHFFSPFRSYSYKPLASETFYLIIRWLNYNVFLGHLIMFVAFLIGLGWMYQNLILLTRQKGWAILGVCLYALNFTHVFQLYWFATFQEIAVLMFLNLSLFKFLGKKWGWGYVWFIAALLCKETAALYPLGLILVWLIDREKRISPKIVVGSFITAGLFYLVYRYSLNQVTTLDNYRMVFDLKLIGNNMAWYLLWAMGLPSLMPLYMPKLLGKPIPEFGNLFGFPEFKIYFIGLGIYLILFLVGLILVLRSNQTAWKKILTHGLIALTGFYFFLGPILFFPHKWMVRLTLPLVFISIFESFVIYKLISLKTPVSRWLTGGILISYLVFNYYGVAFHESAGLFLSEDDIFLKTEKLFELHREEIKNYPVIFLYDEPWKKNITSINSERLKNSYHDQSFLDYFFPDTKIKAVYNFETQEPPPGAYVINTTQILK